MAMELEEYTFVYEDFKTQIKQLPHIQVLLRVTEKSTRKLECINLYSVADKRDFDLQLEQQQIIKQIKALYKKLNQLKHISQIPNNHLQVEILSGEITNNMQEIKQCNIQIFDLLNKQDELLSAEIEAAGECIEEENQPNLIKEEDEFEYENIKDSQNDRMESEAHLGRKVTQLKAEIEEISAKIAKLGAGRGKWYQTDHQDFLKIYNRCSANPKKIIDQAVKMLGMNSTQIMDHLQLYENYLQLQKEKKIITEEYRQIKLMEKLEDDEKKEQAKKEQDDRTKLRKQKEIEENQKKKELVMKYKEKKNQEKNRMIEEQEKKEKEKILRIPIPPAKKKQIMERNHKYILQKQNNFKKVQQKVEQKQQPRIDRSKQRLGSISKLRPGSQSKIQKGSQGTNINKI